jgi:hypothetical protein
VRPSAQRFNSINKREINMKHSLRIETGSSYKNLQEHRRTPQEEPGIQARI